MSKCWYCNEELTTANYCDEHIGICTKCYGSMFKVSNEFVKGLTDKIANLEQQLSLTEKALELACEELYDSDSISICAYCPYDMQDECADECPQNTKVLEKYFKTKAKEMIKSE